MSYSLMILYLLMFKIHDYQQAYMFAEIAIGNHCIVFFTDKIILEFY